MRLELCAVLVSALASVGSSQADGDQTGRVGRLPGEQWLAYASAEQAGFSSEALESVRERWEATQSAGYMVVYRGAVLVAWGDLERRFKCHSVRKSFLSALIGTEVDSFGMDLGATLAELGITDDGVDGPGLTETESTATVHDLIRARSGVYRLAAYEPPQNPKPERGAYAPDEFWCYNNWDFNALLTIFELESGARIFEAFDERIAGPIGMQDYRPRDGYYHHEGQKSQHPAYPFRMSGRDMARFGLLYLNEGRWGEQQILSKDWVAASATPHSSEGVWGGGGYGYMWWVSGDERLAELGSYSARGVGGQLIQVLPGADLVLVNRTNTFAGQSVSERELVELAHGILDAARPGTEPSDEPELVPMEDTRQQRFTPAPLPDHVRRRLLRPYQLTGRFGGMTIRAEGDTLVAELNPQGIACDLIPIDESRFVLEGSEEGLLLELGPDAKGDRMTHESVLNRAGYEHFWRDDFAAAVEVFERNVELFPWSSNCWDSLGEGRLAAGDLDGALEAYRRSVELDPNHVPGFEAIARIEAQLVESK